MIDLSRLKPRLGVSGRVQVSGVPQGLDAMILPEVAKAIGSRAIVHVALDDQRAAVLADQLAFFAPELEVLRFPAWDCLPMTVSRRFPISWRAGLRRWRGWHSR